MVKTAKKSVRATKSSPSKAKKVDIYPFRVLYLVIFIAVTAIVLFAYLGVSNDI